VPILCNITFEIVTPESAADGDAAERGFISEGQPFTFRELVEWMRGGEPSSWPASGDVSEWVSQSQGETRAYFERGEDETRAIHYSRDNAPRMARYWALAMRAAGLTREGSR
jgi:hypothetical protein